MLFVCHQNKSLKFFISFSFKYELLISIQGKNEDITVVIIKQYLCFILNRVILMSNYQTIYKN